MTTSADVLALVSSALLTKRDDDTYPTPAEDRVKRPGDLPTQSEEYPILKLRLVSETRQATGRGSIGFTTTATIRVVGEVSAQADLGGPDNSDIEAQLWALKRASEIAIINSYPLFGVVSQLSSVQSQLSFTAQATHLAGIQADFAFEFWEDGDDFAPIAATVVTGFDVHLPAGPGFSTSPPL
ncbi:MAG: hypothetical protein ACRYGP_05815 [Janthinobacterium lividum]